MSRRLQPSGILVVFEGIDGAGKTTQAGLLEERLRPLDVEIVRTKEPTNGVWGRRLRASASTGRLAPADELHAFLEDRKEHVATLIRPSLAAGKVVIVDRYYFSTAAYQGARGADPDELIRINEEFAPKPDLLVLLAVTPGLGIARIQQRGDAGNLFEREEDLARSAAIFGRLDAPYLLRLDGSQAVQPIAEQIEAAVMALPAMAALG
jgi:dTMP kinase